MRVRRFKTGRAAPRRLPRLWILGTLASSIALIRPSGAHGDRLTPPCEVAVLAYHRFGPAAIDSMTVRTESFREQMRFLRDKGWSVIPLADLISALRDPAEPLPHASVVITIDDGHRSVWTELRPEARSTRTPVTLFIYPSAISNATYALTWDQLRALRDEGFDIEAHTYWHPRFDRERARLSPAEYDAFVTFQLQASRDRLEQRLGRRVSAMAWPFGLYSDDLIARARRAGYVAAFTLDRRCVTRADDPLALPRFLVTETTWRAAFRQFTAGSSP